MKKGILVLAIFASVFAFASLRSVQAADVSVGGSMWVAEWDPFFEKALESSGNLKLSVDPGIVAGPVVSVRLSDAISWSNVLLIGKFDGSAKDTAMDLKVIQLDTLRCDLDSTLNFSLNRYLKVFCGLKAMYIDYTMSYPLYPQPDQTFENKAVGPGLGFALSLPVTDSLFVLFNLSGLYMSDQMSGNQNFPTLWFNIYGVNSTCSLAYYFASTNITASAGLRYQQLRYSAVSSSSSAKMFDNTDDKFYGLVLSVLYTF